MRSPGRINTTAIPLSLLVLVLSACGPVWASTIWVDRFNTGPEDGSSEHPFNTIQEGMDVAVYGDTVLVRPGVYDHTFDEQKTAQHWTVGVDMTDGVTLKSEQGAHITIIDGAGGDGGVFFCGVGSDTRVTGFAIRNSQSGVLVYYGPADNTPIIEGNVFRDNCSGVKTWSGNGYECAPTIRDNEFPGGVGLTSEGVYIMGQAEHNNHHLIIDNEFGPELYYGIFAWSKADPYIHGNYFASLDVGICTYFWCNPDIRYNTIVACETGIQPDTHCSPIIQANYMADNEWNVWASGYFNGFFTIDAENNYWGFDDEESIQASIHDCNDDPVETVEVDYDPWVVSTGLPDGVGEPVPATWSSVKAMFR
jgi:hypothetical protein